MITYKEMNQALHNFLMDNKGINPEGIIINSGDCEKLDPPFFRLPEDKTQHYAGIKIYRTSDIETDNLIIF